MSRPPPIPDPLDCVLFDAGDTLLAPAPSFQGRFVVLTALDHAGGPDPDGVHRVEDLTGLVRLVYGHGSG